MATRVIKTILYIPIWILLTFLQVICVIVSACSEVLARIIAFLMYVGLVIIFISTVQPVSEILGMAGLATFILFIPEIGVLLGMGVTWVKAEVSDWLVW